MEKIQKFENILDLEFEVTGAKASITFMPGNTPLYRKDQIHKAYRRAKDALFEAISTLTPEELEAFGKYRLESMAKKPE